MKRLGAWLGVKKMWNSFKLFHLVSHRCEVELTGSNELLSFFFYHFLFILFSFYFTSHILNHLWLEEDCGMTRAVGTIYYLLVYSSQNIGTLLNHNSRCKNEDWHCSTVAGTERKLEDREKCVSSVSTRFRFVLHLFVYVLNFTHLAVEKICSHIFLHRDIDRTHNYNIRNTSTWGND